VRHLAFFRAASAELEGSGEYRALLAGVVVMRLLDKYRSRDGDPERRLREFTPVQQAVDALDDGPDRRALQRIVDAIATYAAGIADTRAERLVEYARCLEVDARWDPAMDAYLTVIDLAPADRTLVPQCYRHASACSRKMGDVDRAAQFLRDGHRIAVEIGDRRWVLKLQITESKLLWHKGDVEAAGCLLDAIIAEADACGWVTIAATARHDRGGVAFDCDQKHLAVQYIYSALKDLDDPIDRLFAIGDLAVGLQDLGYVEHARTLLLMVYHSPLATVEARNRASLNMLYGSALAGEQPQFDLLSRELRDQRLTARQRAAYHLFLGQGYLKFDEPWRAQVEFAEAAVVARANGEGRSQREAADFLETGLGVILDAIRHRRGVFEERAAPIK
jgi:hypothetical protein